MRKVKPKLASKYTCNCYLQNLRREKKEWEEEQIEEGFSLTASK